MKKLIYLMVLLLVPMTMRAQYIPGLLDTLWYDQPDSSEFYSGLCFFHPSGEYFFAAWPDDIENTDTTNFNTYYLVNSNTGALIDTIFYNETFLIDDQIYWYNYILDFSPGKDSLLVERKVYQNRDSVVQICIYDMNQRKIVKCFRPNIEIFCACNYNPSCGGIFSYTGDTLIMKHRSINPANSEYERAIDLWDIDTGELLFSKQYEKAAIGGNPNGSYYFVNAIDETLTGSRNNLLYVEDLNDSTVCDYGVSIADTSSKQSFSNSRGMFSPSGRFIAIGTGEYIYDALNREPYLTFKIDDYAEQHTSLIIRNQIDFFIDDRFALFLVEVLDSTLDTVRFERWIFDIENAQVVHRDTETREEREKFHAVYDAVSHHYLYYSHQNKTRMYKINVDMLYNVSMKEPMKYDDTLFPNPASDKINIKLDKPEFIREIKLLDLQGQEIKIENFEYHLNNDTIEIQSNQLKSGTYLISVVTSNSIRTFKVLIIR